MIFTVHNNYTYITGFSSDEEKVLKFFCDSYKIEFQQYYRDKRGKGSFVAESISLIHPAVDNQQQRYFYFLSGLLTEVLEYLDKKYDVHPQLVQTTPFLALSDLRLQQTLRDYQFDIVEQVLLSKRAVVKAAVGAGKTLCMAAILSMLYHHKALIIAPAKDLRDQLYNNFYTLIPDYRIITADEYKKSGDTSFNAIIDLPINLGKLPPSVLSSCPVLLMDEAHGAPAQRTMEVILENNAPYRFGFTATPEGRSDHKDKLIVGLFGPVLDSVDFQMLRDEGYVPDLEVTLYYSGWNDDYHYVEDLLIVNNKRRNDLIASIVRKHLQKNPNGLILVMSRKLAHLDLLAKEYFPEALVLTGESLERQERIDEIKQGKYQIVLASNIFSQGINIPQFTLGINASGGKSAIVTEQKAGRMVRGSGVKHWVDIYDNYTNMLEKHSLARAHTYQTAFEDINIEGFPERYDLDAKLARMS